jgi:hypothetical protein
VDISAKKVDVCTKKAEIKYGYMRNESEGERIERRRGEEGERKGWERRKNQEIQEHHEKKRIQKIQRNRRGGT